MSKQQSKLARLIERNIGRDGTYATQIPRLFLFRSSHSGESLPEFPEPALCIVAQGRTRVMLADKLYVFGPDLCVVVSVELPYVGHVIDATPATPYLSLRLDLDSGQLSALMMEIGMDNSQVRPGPLGRGISVKPIGPTLLDAAMRLVRLLESPEDIAVLAPLIEREILYLLLSDNYCPRLWEIAVADSRVLSVNRAIRWLKRNYASPFRIETLAREARMSASALHRHFKSVTGVSPLQYQKQVRLLEARRLMLGQALDAATASHRVGYESPSQFSREYRRLFGAPPSRDITQLKKRIRVVDK